jgi:hypothetical protein
MSTYLELCQDFREYDTSYAGSSGTPTTVVGQTGSLGRVVQWIADACEEIDNLHMDWNYLWGEKEWTLTTGASGRVYSLGDLSLSNSVAYWKRDGMVYNPDADTYWRMTFVPWREWRQSYRLGTKLSEEPTLWTVRPDKGIEFNCNPSTATTVRAEYGAVRTRLVNNGDNPNLPEHFQRLIRLRAQIMYAEYEAASEVLAIATAEYNDLLRRAEAELLPEQEHRATSERSEPLEVVVI